MKAITQHDLHQSSTYHSVFPVFSLSVAWHKLIAYAESQEEKRFAWAAISLLGHGTCFTVATMSIVMLTGNSFALLVATCLSMAMVLVVNLAALPTKYIIPVFFFSLFADIVIITAALVLW